MPPTHELFLNQTLPELNQEMMEDLMIRRREITEELEEDDRPQSRQEILMTQLRSINRAIGEETVLTADDLAEYWDAQLARGETTDLDMMPDDLRRLREESP